jgi:hypothetical protein
MACPVAGTVADLVTGVAVVGLVAVSSLPVRGCGAPNRTAGLGDVTGRGRDVADVVRN